MSTARIARRWAALGTSIFFVAVPGTVAGLVPWAITRWQVGDLHPFWSPLRGIGVAVLAVAAPVLIHSFVRFVVEGLGTPAPVAATENLVVGGIYRYVRNPMYLAVVAAIVGQALILGQPSLGWYALTVALLQAAFVRFVEEPGLRARFGAQYEAYRAAVPAWWPRLRPWRGADIETDRD